MPVIPFEGHTPKIHPTAFIAPTALVLGAVEIGAHASVWYGAVLRGDLESILVGANSNIQDNAVLHTGKGEPCIIGESVTVGHAAIVHGCEIGDGCLVGMGACVLNRAIVGEECIIGAKALVPEDRRIEPRSLVVGVPAKTVRSITDADLEPVRIYAARYIENGRRHLSALAEWEKSKA